MYLYNLNFKLSFLSLKCTPCVPAPISVSQSVQSNYKPLVVMKPFVVIFLVLGVHTTHAQTFDDYARAGVAAGQQQNYREALNDFIKAYNLQPTNAEINQRVGLMYFCLYKYDSAIQFYNVALAQNPKDSQSYFQRGYSYLSMNEFQNGLDDFVKCTKLLKKVNPEVLYYMGKCDEGLGRWDDAIYHFNQDLTFRPGNKLSLYEVAYCYTLIFDKTNAMKYYNKAIDQDPNYYDAYLNRGLLFESQFNNPVKALDDLEKSIELKPNSKLSYLYEGLIYNDEHKFDKAKDIYDKVIDMYPDFAEAYYQRAIAWQGMGNLNMVCADLNTAEKLGYKKATEYKKDICK